MYEILSNFAQTWGLIAFILLFAAVLVYAFWPGNRDRFNRAASMPLNDADTPETPEKGDGTESETGDRNNG